MTSLPSGRRFAAQLARSLRCSYADKTMSKIDKNDDHYKRRDAFPHKQASHAVSDIDAVNALLAEAEARTQAKLQLEKQRHDESMQHRKKRPRQDVETVDGANDYYGPSQSEQSTAAEKKKNSAGGDVDDANKAKPNFGLSGALATDSSARGGSLLYKGILLKFHEPPEARTPQTQWRLYVFKGNDQIDTLHVS